MFEGRIKQKEVELNVITAPLPNPSPQGEGQLIIKKKGGKRNRGRRSSKK